MGSNKSGMLCTSPWATATSPTVVVLSPNFLCISFPRSLSRSHTDQNHIPNTTGFQSNHTHHNPLIKLICRDPHLPFRPQSNAPPPRTKSHDTLTLAAAQAAQMPPSSQNVTPDCFLISAKAAVPRPERLLSGRQNQTRAAQHWTADHHSKGMVHGT